jgi:hypothetical protein
MPEDRITLTILEDGTIRTETEGLSRANHASADAFVKGVDALMGGQVEVKQKRKHTHTHVAHVHKQTT